MSLKVVKSRKIGLLKDGVIFEASSPDEAIMAYHAGGKAIVVKDPNASNKCMCDPTFLYKMIDATPLPVIARVRTGHVIEAQLMELAGANVIEESPELEQNNCDMYIDMAEDLKAPGIVRVTSIPDIARAVTLGASGIYLYGNGDPTALISQKDKLYKDLATGLKQLNGEIPEQSGASSYQPNSFSFGASAMALAQGGGGQILGPKDGEYRAAAEKICRSGKIPLPMFAYKAVSTPLDAALLMDEGFAGIVVGNNLFGDNVNPVKYANAFVNAVKYYNESKVLRHIAFEMGRGAYGAATGGGGGGNISHGFTGGMPAVMHNGSQQEKKAAMKDMNDDDVAAIARKKLAAKKAK